MVLGTAAQRHRLVAAITVVLLIGGCSPAPTTSPSPVAPSLLPSSPAASMPTPTPSRSIAPTTNVPGWSYTADGWFSAVRFAPDGAIVTVEVSTSEASVRVVRLGSDGTVAHGWSWTRRNTDLADAAPGPRDSTYVIARTVVDIGWKWALHRLDARGREMAGFPVALSTVEFCRIAVAPDGFAFVACASEEATGAFWTTTVRRLAPDGRMAAGWPTALRGDGTPIGFRRNGDVVLSVNDYDLAASRGGVSAVVLQRGGRPEPAWRVLRFSDLTTLRVDALGRVIAVSHVNADGECGAPISTMYRVLGANGRPASGWPAMIKGWGSAPVVRDDGSLVIAASGGRVGAWSSAGHSLQGWPVSGVDMATGCDTGSTPIAAGGGAVVVLGDKAVTMLDAHGAVAAGWPVHLSDPVARTCMSCTPGPADPISPVVTSAGIYVPLYARLGGQVRIAVFGLDGRPAASWDGLIGVPGDELISLQAAPDGAVWAVARHPDSTGPRDSLVLVGSRQAAP